jgi:rare lipoprotein A
MEITAIRVSSRVNHGESFLLLGILLLGIYGCHPKASHVQIPSTPLPPVQDKGGISATPIELPDEEKEGVASWYGHPYHGRRTTSGEIYNMNDFTAAHRTLPFDAIVQVQNLDNGKEVQVRINDRGPFVNNRIIDLSFAAASKINMVGPGTARVRLDILESARSSPPFTLQVGAFKEKANAERLQKLLASTVQPIFIRPIEDERGLFFRVFAGQYFDYKQASQQLQKFRENRQDGFVVRLDPEIPKF